MRALVKTFAAAALIALSTFVMASEVPSNVERCGFHDPFKIASCLGDN